MAFVRSAESPEKIAHPNSSFRKSQGESDSKYFWNPQHSWPSAINYFCKDRKSSVIVVIRASAIKRWMVISIKDEPLRCHGTVEDCHQSAHDPVSQCLSRPEGVQWIHRAAWDSLTRFCIIQQQDRQDLSIWSNLSSLPHRKGLPREDGINFQDSIDEINTISWFFFFCWHCCIKEI